VDLPHDPRVCHGDIHWVCDRIVGYCSASGRVVSNRELHALPGLCEGRFHDVVTNFVWCERTADSCAICSVRLGREWMGIDLAVAHLKILVRG